MDRAGVKAALIVQPKNHGFDHSYMTSVIRRHPSRFKGMLLADPRWDFGASHVTRLRLRAHAARFRRFAGVFAFQRGPSSGCCRDPSDGGRGVEQMEELVRNEGYCGVRFHPYIWPAGERMTNAVGKALYKKAGELGVPGECLHPSVHLCARILARHRPHRLVVASVPAVGHMVMKGLLQHIDEIEELIAFSPETTVVLDHFAFCPMDEPDHAAWDRLVALARHPNVYIKLSAFFRVTSAKHPYPAAPAKIRQLVDAFGAQRLMWGTDWPWVTEVRRPAHRWRQMETQRRAPARCTCDDHAHSLPSRRSAITQRPGPC